ncbi:NAD(P)H-dependent oxidoreductase [Pseudomonas sp. RIT-To-2]|uniref:NAD(P)H-dependent oxidoreductase n=1 Tax=Pseudomonas sp. RIT-To-2 TaxID=3462541 RepID=UPI002412FFE9
MAKTFDPTVHPGTAGQLDRRGFIKTGVGITAAMVIPSFVNATAIAAVTVAPSAISNEGKSGKRALVINAHQTHHGISEGRLNRTMAALIADEMKKHGYTVRQTYIESGYDVSEEVEKHLWADVIVTQSPIFWFGNPWLYKKYVDEVFTAGLIQQSFLGGDGRSMDDPSRQYGSGGKMQGKRYLLSLTMNSPREAFDDPKQKLHQGRSVDEVFAANTANYRFCGAEVLPIFACYDVISAPTVEQDIKRLKDRIGDEFG